MEIVEKTKIRLRSFNSWKRMGFLVILFFLTIGCAGAQTSTTLPIGMNLGEVNYYSPNLMFNDVMKTASEMITTWGDWGQGGWDTGKIGEIPRDPSGYPLSLPYKTSDGQDTYVRFLISNLYKGKYKLEFQGRGSFGGSVFLEDGNWYLLLDGSGENKYVDLKVSDPLDPVRDLQILPTNRDLSKPVETFHPKFLEGLRPFHALRFMEVARINNSPLVHWKERTTPSWYTQGDIRGVSFEYMVELCNLLNVDAWVCVPHGASDEFIIAMASLWKKSLNPGLKIYVEYSNEIWNWMFSVASYVDKNAPGAPDISVSEGLRSVKDGYLHYKMGYMMARTFRLWNKVFQGQEERIITVGTGQHFYEGLSAYVLEYLFDVDKGGCEAFAVAGYFAEDPELHSRRWSEDPSLANTPDKIILALNENFDRSIIPFKKWDMTSPVATRKTAELVRARGIPYLVYEGGQHLQPFEQKEWEYNPVLWEAQVHPGMYDLYQKNFRLHREPEVNCQLFMAFTYIYPRKSRYGSWGHLENLDMIGKDYHIVAPKYQALLDNNSPRP